jgi:hypothetical protein
MPLKGYLAINFRSVKLSLLGFAHFFSFRLIAHSLHYYLKTEGHYNISLTAKNQPSDIRQDLSKNLKIPYSHRVGFQ